MRLSYMVIAALFLNILFLKGEDLNLPDLNVDYKLKVAEIKVKLFDRAIENLEGKYRKRVKDLKSEYSKKGQLDAALSAEESINIIPTEGTIEKYTKFKALSEIHKIYVESAEKIQNRYDVELIKVMKSYLEKLEKLKVSLTKQENLELAKTVQKQIKSVKESYLYRNRFKIDEVLTELNKKRPNRLLNNHFDKGLIAYYPFDGNANDESFNTNHGVLEGGVKLTQDRHEISKSAYNFDGTGRIKIPDGVYFHGNFTISAWIKVSDYGNYSRILDFRKKSEDDITFILSMGTSGKPRGDVKGNNNSVLSSSRLTLNVWTHVLWTLDEKITRLYINGNLAASQSWDFPPANVRRTNNWLGGNMTNIENMSGALDDVRIYNRALSEVEISELYEFEKEPKLKFRDRENDGASGRPVK